MRGTREDARSDLPMATRCRVHLSSFTRHTSAGGAKPIRSSEHRFELCADASAVWVDRQKHRDNESLAGLSARILGKIQSGCPVLDESS